ncbi:hypothetical protein GQ43DRAFT_443139, partial [Delitschia confertaspora ATCC 74209]
MFDFTNPSTPSPKCYFTHSLLSSYVDPTHLPNKKQPFSTISKQPFSHNLDLVLPEEIYDIVRNDLFLASQPQLQPQNINTNTATSPVNLQYARVYMKLGDILSGDFFNQHVKQGNIALLSSGRPNIDDSHIFSLRAGILRIELDRATYERCGLQGRPIEDGGKKHKKARFVVEYDLKASSAVAGKKGFQRLMRATETVLNKTVTWLFCDLDGNGLKEGPILKHQPVIYNVQPSETRMEDVLVPRLHKNILEEVVKDQDECLELLEWLHLVSLKSPRLFSTDSISEFLSRYRVPDFTDGSSDGRTIRNIVRLRWRGFITPEFVKEVYLLLSKKGMGGAANEEESRAKWFALTANSFEGYGGCYTIMQFKGRETLVWES